MKKEEEKIETEAVQTEKVETEKPVEVQAETTTTTDENGEKQVTETVEVEKQEVQQQKAICPNCGNDPCTCQDEIRAAGELAQEEELANDCIKNHRSLADFKKLLKEKRSQKNQNKENKTMEKFSISKAIRNACSQYKKDVSEQYETKVINENKRNLGIVDADIVLTKKELTRALAPTTGNGKELITGEYLPQEFTPFSRPQNTLEKTGFYSIPVEGQSVSFAVVTSGSTAAMYDLDGELADGDMTFATRELKPHKAGVCIPVPYSLILQARPEVDAIVEDDIVKALDQIRDEQILIGTGLSGQVTGIANTAGVNTVSGAASAVISWEGVLEMEQKIRDANEFGQLHFVMNGNNYRKYAATLKSELDSFAGFLLEDDKIKDYTVFVNNALDDNTIILGDFSQVVVADFEGLKLKIDDITYVKKQAIQIIATKAFDVVLRKPKAFCIGKIAD